MSELLREQVGVVARARLAVEEGKAAKKQSLAQWEADNEELLTSLNISEALCREAEDALRAMTLEAYQATGDKAPAQGVGVRLVTKLTYDMGQAFEWAIEHKVALKLDIPTFEKLAKASPLPFVAINQEAQATIATALIAKEEVK